MEIYLSEINESWIVDRLRKEWYENNPKISTKKLNKSNIIWIISPWLWGKIRKKYLKNNKVVCSIYHFEEKDFDVKNIKEFKIRDQYVDCYHVISPKTKQELQKLTNKEIIYIPFWVNEDIWFEIKEKKTLREKYQISTDSFVIGSFQRDTEGSDLKSPKLIKGPDRFIEIVKEYNKKEKDIAVLLTGKRRQFLINELEKLNIKYLYFEMVDFKGLNELYNCLDLYIVASRVEGGPQAIVECGITKTPIISTDVGFASDILGEESIFNMDNYKNAKPNIEIAYKNSKKLSIPKGFDNFINMFESLNEKF